MLKNDKKDFPAALPLKKMIGPSFIILALSLGSGEIILWPYLVSNYGLGIAWGAILGITFQFFINMEIERYALVKGESVFVGIAKFFRYSAHWFIFSTFIGFGLPGILAASAKVLSALFGWENFKYPAILLLVLIGVILISGRSVYQRIESITKIIIFIGTPFIFILALILSQKSDWSALIGGLAGRGDGFWFLPAGISLAAFLGAFAYSGAGGNLNLTQSLYVKEKGYGMGKYSQKIAGLFTRKDDNEKIKLEGEDFEINESNKKKFKLWWKRMNWEHLIIFWFLGSVSMLFLMLLSFSTAFGNAGNDQSINFVINEAAQIGSVLHPAIGALFLAVIGIMLFQTQLCVMDSTSRIMAENLAIIKLKKGNKKVKLGKIYHSFVWAQVLFGSALFLFNVYEPKTLIILAAVINAFAMTVHIALVYLLNKKALPSEFKPKKGRKFAIFVIFLFYLFFSGLVLFDKMKTLFFR